MIMFEDFSLSTSIASCEVKTNTPAAEQCGVDMGSITIFLNGNLECTTVVADGTADANGWCYHVPTQNSNLFNS